jgi:Protein of unknown function (DUF2924)
MASVNIGAIDGEITRFRFLGLEELRREWRRLNHSEPPRISRDLLILALGYRLQEIAHGGLGKATRPLKIQYAGLVQRPRATSLNKGSCALPSLARWTQTSFKRS